MNQATRTKATERFLLLTAGVVSSAALAFSVLGMNVVVSVPYNAPSTTNTNETLTSTAQRLDSTASGKLVLIIDLGDKPGTLTLPVRDFKGTIDWGDGSKLDTTYQNSFSGSAPITRLNYPAHQHLLTLTGTVHTITSEGASDSLVGIKHWDNDLGLTHFDAQNTHNFKQIPTNLPTTLTSLEGSFSGSDFNSPNVSDWETSRITNVKDTFTNDRAFNQPLNWDVSQAK